MIKSVSYKRHRFPPEIIAHAVWLYFKFPLSLRLVEEMLLERGILVSYETVRRWALKFGPDHARRLKRKAPRLWRAVDQDGHVLDEIVQTRRNAKAAKRLLKRLLKKPGRRKVRRDDVAHRLLVDAGRDGRDHPATARRMDR